MIKNKEQSDYGPLPEFVAPKTDEECTNRLNNLSKMLGLTMSRKAFEYGALLSWVKDKKAGHYLEWLTENVKAFRRTTDWRQRSFYQACKSAGRLLDYQDYIESRKGEKEEQADDPCFNLKHEGGASELATSRRIAKLPPVTEPPEEYEEGEEEDSDEEECGDEDGNNDGTSNAISRPPRKPTKTDIEREQCRKKMMDLAINYAEMDGITIWKGDFRQEMSKINDASVNAVFTDPPWGKEWLPYWDDLGSLAKRVLVDGGFLVTYCPQRRLPEVLSALGKHLEYFWPFVTEFSTRWRVWDLQIFTRYRMIVAYFKPPLRCPQWPFDVMKSKREENLHPWQQAEAPFAYLIKNLTKPGDLILDPCAGVGTTLVVCKKLGRRCTGIELDEETVQVMKGRLVELQQIELQQEAA